MYAIEVEQGVRIAVEDLHPGNGRPLVFLHGWPVNRRMFEYQFAQLPKYGFRCIGIDIRGFGKSDCPWSGYDYNRLADDVRVVFDTLRLQNAVLIGFSMGGAIAIRYMARHSGYGVAKLALLAASAPRFTRNADYPFGLTTEEVNALIYQTYTDRPRMLSEFGRKFFASAVSPAFADWFQSLGLEASTHGTAMCAASLRDEDLRRDVLSLRLPVGIFHGVLDQIVPFESAAVLNRHIPGSVLYRFEQSGHGVFYDELHRFNTAFLKFLHP